MINYKSFKLPGNAKLRVRADQIVATVSSKEGKSIDIYVNGVTAPWHLPIEGAPSKVIDYVWELQNIEKDEDEEEGENE